MQPLSNDFFRPETNLFGGSTSASRADYRRVRRRQVTDSANVRHVGEDVRLYGLAMLRHASFRGLTLNPTAADDAPVCRVAAVGSRSRTRLRRFKGPMLKICLNPALIVPHPQEFWGCLTVLQKFHRCFNKLALESKNVIFIYYWKKMDWNQVFILSLSHGSVTSNPGGGHNINTLLNILMKTQQLAWLAYFLFLPTKLCIIKNLTHWTFTNAVSAMLNLNADIITDLDISW